MSEIINGSICLSDIDKSKIINHSNGKKYLNICVAPRMNVDAYGNTHTIYISQSKEERERKDNKCYIGSGKEFVFNSNPNLNTQEPHSAPSSNNDEIDDLPF